MATKKKLLEAAAGSAGGAGLNVEEVFSTYLYTGNSSTQTITNGIDLAGEGGLVWTKLRSGADGHAIQDTERGANKILSSNNTNAEVTESWGYSFNSNGFSLNTSSGQVNASGSDYASWTFRKAPKFFDVVTYTGDTSSAKQIAHNLGSTPACIFIKRTDDVTNWLVYHKDIPGSNGTGVGFLKLNTTDNDNVNSNAFPTQPTSTHFTVNANYGDMNASGATYVAYLFAHNDGDGDFGPTGDQDIIKCGSYTGTGALGNNINLGFEPQFVIVKVASISGESWWMLDSMRGMPVQDYSGAVGLRPNTNNAEATPFGFYPTATGFSPADGGGAINQSGQTYIYIAIRRGPMAVPESATEVFAVDTQVSTAGLPSWKSGFPVDMFLYRDVNAANYFYAAHRLTYPKTLQTGNTSAEGTSNAFSFDYSNGTGDYTTSDATNYSWMWKRAPNFFDVVAYTGNGVAGRTVSHNLGVAPEMIWVKKRSSADNWRVYHSDIGINYRLGLDSSAAASYDPAMWNGTSPTDTNFTVGSDSSVNGSGSTYIAYLFASLAGVSKVGSYTGTGATLNIDCGFSSGARFVLIKRTDNTGEWRVLDTARGIVAGNDPLLNLNSTNPEEAFDDLIDPYSAGFTLTSNPMVNTNNANYIFYAIA